MLIRHALHDQSSEIVDIQGCKRPFVALFGGTGAGGRPRLHALLSRSSHGLRERLRAPPHGLRFGTPLAPDLDGPAAAVRDERMQAELRAIGQVAPCLLCPPASGTAHHQ